jgi:predicted porin
MVKSVFCKRVALSSVLVSGAALANEATIYGTLDIAFMYVSNPNQVKMRQGNLAASKLGFRGVENLNSDASVIYTMEAGVDPIGSTLLGASDNFFNRQSFLGFSSKSLGTVTTGVQYTPYFQMVGALASPNALTGATGSHPGDLDSMNTTLRFKDSVKYTSPSMAGVTVGAHYGLNQSSASKASNQEVFSGAIKYDVDNFSVAGGYIGTGAPVKSGAIYTIASNSPVNSAYTSAKASHTYGLATRYQMGDYMVGANYSNVAYIPNENSKFTDRAIFNTFAVIARYTPNNKITLAAGYSDTRLAKANGISDAAVYRQLSLKQEYALSTRTALYAIQGYQLAGGQNLSKIGDSLAIVDAVASVGDSQNNTPSSTGRQLVAMFGIRHNF